jgi:hypothetical protein
MATQGVILTIQQHARSDVWLSDESQEARVRELERFLENPADPRYLAAELAIGQTNSGLHYRRFLSGHAKGGCRSGDDDHHGRLHSGVYPDERGGRSDGDDLAGRTMIR